MNLKSNWIQTELTEQELEFELSKLGVSYIELKLSEFELNELELSEFKLNEFECELNLK